MLARSPLTDERCIAILMVVAYGHDACDDAVVAVASVAMTMTVFKVSGHQSRTLMPPVLSEKITVSDISIDQSYLRQMSEYFL